MSTAPRNGSRARCLHLRDRMETNGNSSQSSFAGAWHIWHQVQELPSRVESGLKTHPLTTVTVIAGVSFVGGMVLGSRVARVLLIATAPAIAQRLLAGPLGDRLERTIGVALRSSPATSPAASTASRKGGQS